MLLRAPVVVALDRVRIVRRYRRTARETNHPARHGAIDRARVARRQRCNTRDRAARRRRRCVRKRRRGGVERPCLSCRFCARIMGDANALRLAAAGWTIAVLLFAWLVVERRSRKAAEFAREERDRESDADRAARMQRQQDAIKAMRDALSALDQATNDEQR